MKQIAFAALFLGVLPACTCAEPEIAGGTRTDRDEFDVWFCEEGDQRCVAPEIHQTCVRDGEFLRTESEDCAERTPPYVCVEGLWCVVCEPKTFRCFENDVQKCSDDGMKWETLEECDRFAGDICYNGDCRNECEVAKVERSNIGCEYFPVDLDNASLTVDEDASLQQFAVVVSNPGDVPATVQVWRNEAAFGEAPAEELVDEVVVPNGYLHTFELDRREVDGTPDGGFDWQGLSSGSAVTGRAYRIVSTHRVVAYQHNPLDNLQVFSNDSSLLLPTSALDLYYVVLSWPQTIAKTNDPSTNFCFLESDPNCDGLHTFLTIVGTEEDTEVTVNLKARAMEIPDLPDLDLRPNRPFTVTLGRYEVLNLETDGFNADFTGSEVESDKPVAVYAGSEASDVPFFDTISERLCCADHLEEQLTPVSALGRRYAATLMPPRTPAVNDAGQDVALVVEPEWFRIMAVEEGTTNVTTTLESPYDIITLPQFGVQTIRAEEDFFVEADQRIAFGQFVASQQVTGIPNRLPGGDPAYILVPPLEQWRDRYVFLVPELYAFDFMTVIAPSDARVFYDDGDMPSQCLQTAMPGTGGFVVYKCQLSFPWILDEIDPITQRNTIQHINQADGVHTISATESVGLLLYGFDAYVSYGNAGGTNVQLLE